MAFKRLSASRRPSPGVQLVQLLEALREGPWSAYNAGEGLVAVGEVLQHTLAGQAPVGRERQRGG